MSYVVYALQTEFDFSEEPSLNLFSQFNLLDEALESARRLAADIREEDATEPVHARIFVMRFDFCASGEEVEIAVARPLVDPVEALARAERVVGLFDDRWAVLSSLARSIREDCRGDLVALIATAMCEV